MIKALRDDYNKNFTQVKYNEYLADINKTYVPIQFRMAETPVFVPKEFLTQLISACESIVDVILRPDFKELTQDAIPKNLLVPNENKYPHCITFDFGICLNENGGLEPQLIEMQAFPTLFAYELLLDEIYDRHFGIPTGFSTFLGGLNRETYLAALKKMLLNDQNPENVILLEVFPEKQKTNIDFYCTEGFTGIKMVCVTKLIKKGRQLFYMNDGKETLIKRIYNRVIFDELLQQEDWVQEKAKVLFEDLDVEWVPHPHWFYRISKYTLPLINHPNIPHTRYLHQVNPVPVDLENYVLKPLFSFAGQGVVIDVTKEDIENIKDPENWILQRKVNYAPIIETPDVPAKAEIRIFYFWEEGAERPQPTNSLSRLSKGKMIGVRFNKDKPWTGGSFCLFEME
ncbi:MAG TPA: hypothetical protein PK191_07930 [Niabella sp.]|nr:hypothetical protein [Niabella sp.]HOZ98476.1 hypothetical protein [Niabella sp.]HQW16004.1 hypothetical protein [Niabella sp.]HQX21244.1 hypothetical protein [Niabella sp.]HRB07930.1 hypothetical protein [Niabella sp.]